ncbi:MAG: putative toxin-antitoxin system toxin component, PIN family [Candidatus Bathyarchaeia archaeon]
MGKKVKVVFDTNVWLSIFMKKILSDEFSQAKQDLTVYVSKDIILEMSKVLLYPKIAEVLSKAGVNEREILRAIEANSIIVKPKMKLQIIDEDAEDNKILECALASGADIIVSGDKHLLKLGRFRKTRILTPREFFDSVNRN